MAPFRKKPRAPLRRKRVYKRKQPARTSVAKLTRQVAKMKSSMAKSVEVKRNYLTAGPLVVTCGQVNVDLTGARAIPFQIMNLGAGVLDTERVGAKVKLIGISLRCQMIQQSAVTAPGRYILDIYRTNELTATESQLLSSLYNVDSVSGVIDANSTRNNDIIVTKTNPQGVYTPIYSKSIYVRPDQFTGQLMYKDFKIFIKRQDILQYIGATTAYPNNVRYIMCLRAQCGNSNATTASTLSTVPVTAANTGALLRYNATCYYTDE